VPLVFKPSDDLHSLGLYCSCFDCCVCCRGVGLGRVWAWSTTSLHTQPHRSRALVDYQLMLLAAHVTSSTRRSQSIIMQSHPCCCVTLPRCLPVCCLLSVCCRRHPALPLMCLPSCCVPVTWQLKQLLQHWHLKPTGEPKQSPGMNSTAEQDRLSVQHKALGLLPACGSRWSCFGAFRG